MAHRQFGTNPLLRSHSVLGLLEFANLRSRLEADYDHVRPCACSRRFHVVLCMHLLASIPGTNAMLGVGPPAHESKPVKAMGNPPGPVKLVLHAVCIMKGIKPARIKDDTGKMVEDFWGPSKLMVVGRMERGGLAQEGCVSTSAKLDLDNSDSAFCFVAEFGHVRTRESASSRRCIHNAPTHVIF